LLQYGRRKGNIIQLCWIPGHFSIVGNEMADKAAEDTISNSSAAVVELVMYIVESFNDFFRN